MERLKQYPIPSCAWKRDLGSIPVNCSSHSPNRGIALGGFGAGSFMYNLSGSFGPWQSLDNVLYQGTWLDSAAFHLYEKAGDQPSRVKCLSADRNLKPGWDKLQAKDAVYYALQPKGWVTYNNFLTRISMKFFSPVIPGNYKETSYPVAVWEFMVHNPLKVEAEVSLMLTFPGIFIGAAGVDHDFHSQWMADRDTKGIVLKSGKGLGEWCLASQERKARTISYLLDWDTGAKGDDVRDEFGTNGRLGDRSLDTGRSSGALAVRIRIKPGRTEYIPFVLSWDFPVVRFGQGTEWYKKYCEYFNSNGNNAFSLAQTGIRNYQAWERKVDSWMKPVIRSKKYPEWLKTAAFNELYYSQFGGIFYSSGLRSKKDAYTLSRYRHIFFEMECMKYPFANTFDVRHYSSLPY
ncbi:MAG: GH116 family glycosyl-hydrolase, partial [bacterium]|nr:GH116 family glycosyl-hydrolase [bacterium]